MYKTLRRHAENIIIISILVISIAAPIAAGLHTNGVWA